MHNPRISIILPTYNGSRWIKESLDSILKQTETNWELIIINDCSKDDTLAICQTYADKDARIKIITNKKNQKLPESLNIGFREAQAKLLTWTSDDNCFKPDALEYMANYLENNHHVDMVSCREDIIDETGKFISTNWQNTRFPFDLISDACNVGACFMYTKRIQQIVGEYDKDTFCAEDYDYWCRIALEGTLHYLNGNMYSYRKNNASLTANQWPTIKKASKIIRLKYYKQFFSKYPQDTRSMLRACQNLRKLSKWSPHLLGLLLKYRIKSLFIIFR